MISIQAFPTARLWSKSGSGDWLRQFFSLHDSGRSALYHGIRGLRLRAGATVWMPSFHCGVEVGAAIRAGCAIEFYDVGPDLTVSVEELEGCLARERGTVLLIHYYGFPQPRTKQIAALCERFGCALIEDCAHALFSRDESGLAVGAAAALAVYSLRKTLPVLDGGALCGTQVYAPVLMPRSSREGWMRYLKAVARKVAGPRMGTLYQELRWRWGDSSGAQPGATPGEVSYDSPMSWASRGVASAVSQTDVVSKRRRNYLQLSQMLHDTPEFRPVFPTLPTGTCPLFLPVWVKRRDEWQSSLKSKGIETFRFGASSPHLVDDRKFSETVGFRRNILCLPIHQDLDLRKMEYLASSFRTLSRQVALI